MSYKVIILVMKLFSPVKGRFFQLNFEANKNECRVLNKKNNNNTQLPFDVRNLSVKLSSLKLGSYFHANS